MAIIVTNCSKRKRIAPAPDLCAGSLRPGSLEAVTREWVGRVKSANPIVEAGQLYCGRQFHSSLQAAKAIEADLLVVSAGLGVLRRGDLIPSYNLTVAPGSSDSVRRVIDAAIGTSDWWQSLFKTSDKFLGLRAALDLAADTAGLILIAMPAPYLEMLERELEQFSAEQHLATRIFTAPSFRFQHSPLNELVMPYDGRLDGPSSPCPGTATDFPARALLHFVTAILPQRPRGSRQVHSDVVARHLTGWPFPARPERKRLPDSELLEIIRANWSHYGSSASGMLRRVRRELGLACEQRRMRDLHACVRAEMEEVP